MLASTHPHTPSGVYTTHADGKRYERETNRFSLIERAGRGGAGGIVVVQARRGVVVDVV
jgi:hypothetical protein